MKAGCLRYTSLPGTSKLYSDFLYHFDRVRPFYQRHYLDRAEWTQVAHEVNYPAEMRHSMVAALRKHNEDSPNLHLLAQPGTVAVVTGQQVGLFSGPSYTIHKALTAARMAAELSAEGIPAVPVFWLATEDHDFEEVNHVWACGPGHEPVKLTVNSGTNGRPRPVGGIVPAEYPVRELRELLREFPYGDDVASAVEAAYQPGRAMGEAFASLLKRLLPRAGLIVMDPMQPEIRALAAPFLREAVGLAPELSELVMARNKTLAEAGYHGQVHVEEKSSLFFLLENGERQALRREGGHYVAAGRKYAAGDLRSRAAELSPNALLRPVMQDYLLPTVAYVGGPAELAYLAQSEVIYRKLLGRFPLVLPRSGFTLLGGRGAKLMERYSLHLTDFFESSAALREKISRRLAPPRLNESFVQARAGMTAAMAGLDAELMALDPSLRAAFQKSRAKIFYQLGKIESKAAREALRRDDRANADAAYLEGLLYPHQHLQERFYTILPFLAQHGPDLVDRLAHQICLDCPDHLIVTP